MQILPQRFMSYYAKNYGENNCGEGITTLMRICELTLSSIVTLSFALSLTLFVGFSFHCIVIAIASNVESSRVDLGVLN